jgi:predicted O-linked N-acetylglucosamine transferase (SPINDLY family)
MLDTFPFCAHTTCSDSLRMGLPLITRSGASFVSRPPTSLLTVVGLPELITATQNEYESLAIDLATHPERLAEIRTRLCSNLKTSPLFDSERYARNIESAYATMYEQSQNGLPPEHFFVNPERH